jgi:AraC-like DNA-binding protein
MVAETTARRSAAIVVAPFDTLQINWSAPGGLLRWQIKRVASYVDEHLDSTFRIRRLAAVVRLGASQFARAFRKTFGCPPSVYVRRRRLAYAQELMLSTKLTLAEIASLSGLADQSHFCRVFRKVMGSTPTQWLRQERLRQAYIPR